MIQQNLPWPSVDEQIVINEMLQNKASQYWSECMEFVQRQIRVRSHDLSTQDKEDIAQDVMIRIHKYLPGFKRESKLRTWITTIVDSCIANYYRALKPASSIEALMEGSPDTQDNTETFLADNSILSVEELVIYRNELEQAFKDLNTFIQAHGKPDRNATIIYMVMHQEESLREAARAVNCTAPVAGHIIRNARRFLRSRLNHNK